MSKAIKNDKQALVPRLRFPEFRDEGEWSEKPLSEVCTVLQGYGFPTAMQGKEGGKYPFCKVSDVSRAVAEQGGLLADAANYVDDADVTKLRAKLIPIGSTVFAKIGEALRLNRRAFVRKKCLIDNNVVGLKGKHGVADDYFVFVLSQLIDLNKHCGGAVPSVNKTTLEAIKIVLPYLEEQQKIADCLSSLDTLIAAQAEKIDALKTHKNGLMQQLFPREGETTPRLRFSEFREAGEWEPKLLDELGELISGLTYSPEDVREKGLLVLRSSNVQSGVISLDDNVYVRPDIKGANLSKPNDILICVRNGSKPLIGKNALIPEGLPLCTHGAFMTIFRAKSPKFVFQLFQTYAYERQVAADLGATINSINGNQFKKYKFYIPVLEDEQKKINDCLSSLDALINAHTKKLDTLKTHKKGLMQQLFPSKEVVGV